VVGALTGGQGMNCICGIYSSEKSVILTYIVSEGLHPTLHALRPVGAGVAVIWRYSIYEIIESSAAAPFRFSGLVISD